jgi:DNA modification methylase
MQAKIIVGDSRSMREVADDSVDLVVTSPPYWHIKDYGVRGQIGYGQTLHRYLRDLFGVWAECHRVLRGGCRLCVNVGDQFARSAIYGRYRVIPVHAEIIAQCEKIGFDFMGSIIWQKKTTVNTTGGANVMGSYPYPPNGIVELDYEFIHIFKKAGRARKVPKEVKEASRLSKAEWKQYFSGHWRLAGARKVGHEARFPDELPRRLIRMFTFAGDTVLDPFLGSGTTARMALALGRNAIGYEINQAFLPGLGADGGSSPAGGPHDWVRLRSKVCRRAAGVGAYVPALGDASPGLDPAEYTKSGPEFYRVADVVGADTLKLDDGRLVRLLGVKVKHKEAVLAYLRGSVLGKRVFLRFDGPGAGAEPRGRRARPGDASRPVAAYVYLRNRIFINAYLIKSGLALPDRTAAHALGVKFAAMAHGVRGGGRGH